VTHRQIRLAGGGKRDWFYDNTGPVTVAYANTIWMGAIPLLEERAAVLNALKNHFLVLQEGDNLAITPKGKEYVEFRGKLSALTEGH
jgi:hypothetical protein